MSGIIKGENVRADFTAAYRVSGAPEWEKMGPYQGADGEFFNVFLNIPIQELYPTDGAAAGRERKLRIKASRKQAETILKVIEDNADDTVVMSPQSSLGAFAQSAAKAGLTIPVDDEDLEDRVLVLTSESRSNDNGWRDTIWTVRAYLGTTNDADTTRMKTIVDQFNEGIKKVAATAAAAY